MKGKSILSVGIFILFILFSVQVMAEDKVETSDCETLLLGKCTTCHSPTRFCQKLGDKSKGSWKRTIKRMAKKKGNPGFTKQDKITLLKCLSKQEEGAIEVCK